MQIALLPLDNRPVSYLLPKQIADFSGIDLILPERKYLGDLNHESDAAYLGRWLNDLKKGLLQQTPTLIIALDNWVYGGLVQSRKHSFSLEKLKIRVETLRAMSLHLYGFSSVMRIANHDNSEEEKKYWKDYGGRIFNWSTLLHKVGRGVKDEESSHEELIEKWYESSKLIPPNVLSDYKSHRDKNFTVNLLWLESVHDKCFEYLIFSCDDSSKYGMNVIEAEYLRSEIRKHNFANRVRVVSGTDEVPLILLTKAILDKSDKKPTLSLYFNSNCGKDQIAKYESSSIYSSVVNQIEILGLQIVDFNNSDITLFVHCSNSVQGDHVFHESTEDTSKNVDELVKKLENCNKPFILLDLAYANGADPKLIEALLLAKINWRNCYGYSAWNTCSNSTGSVLAIGINRGLSEGKKKFNDEAFKKCLLTRFLDDYAYQTQIRHTKVTEEEINNKIKNYVGCFLKLLGLNNISVKCTLPWQRSFEVEIKI